MANKLRMDLELDSKGYVQGAQEASHSTKDLEQATRDYLKEFGPLTKQFKNAKNEARNLAAQFALLSKTERESEIGQNMAEELEIAIKKAAEVKNALKDVDDAINRASSDTVGIEGIQEVFDIGRSAAMGFAGALTQVSGDSKALNGLLKTLAITEGIFGTVTKLATALQKESKTMMALQQAGVISYTQALKINNTVEAASITMTKALGVAMKALPFVGIVAAIGSVIGILMQFTNKTKEATESEKALAQSTKNIAQAYGSTLSSKITETITKFSMLRTEYQNLSSTTDKVQWIKENQSAFNELGIAIKTVNDADNVLIRQAADVITALQLKAEAAALYAQYQKAMEETTQITPDIPQDNEGTYGIAPIDPTIYSGAMVNQVNEAYKPVLDRITQINAKISELLGKYEYKGKGNKELTKKEQTELQRLEAEVAKYKKQLESIPKDAPDFDDIAKPIKESLKNAEKDLKDYKIKIGYEVEKPKSTLDKLKDELKQAEAELPFAISEEDVEKAQAKIKEIKGKIEKEEIRLKIKPEVDLSKAKEDIDKITRKLNAPKEQKYDFSFLPDNFRDQADDALDRLNELKNARNEYNNIIESNSKKAIEGDKLAIEYISQAKTALSATDTEYIQLTNDVQKFNDVSSKIKERTVEIENFKNAISTVSTVVGSIDNVVSSFKNLASAFEEDKDGWEQLMAVISFVITMFNTVATIMEVVNTIQDIFNVKKALGNKELMQEAVLHGTIAGEQAAEVGTTTALAGTQTGAAVAAIALAKATKLLAAAQMFAAHAYIPFVGAALGAAQVAIMEGVLAGVAAFAHGGIVEGNSYSGDKIIARVNSGEMILNQQQQSRLFNLLNGNITPQNNNLTFSTVRVQGSDLILAIKNELKVTGQKTLF